MPIPPGKDLRSVVNSDGAAILDVAHNTMITLNNTGGFIWQRLQQKKSPDEIATELAAQTGADAVIVEHDIREFLEQLKTRNLLGD
jgi:hypothetical protein